MEGKESTLERLKILPVLFRKQDAEKLAPHTGTFLSRAVQKKFIHRINRGNYINSFLHGFAPVEEVACFLRPTAYISCEWALNYHGISLQAPTVCSVITLSPSVGKKRNVCYQGITIEFSRISPALFFGFVIHDQYLMASPEKAILDTLYLHKTIPARDELELDGVDLELVKKWAELFPSSLSRSLDRLFNLNSS